MNHNTLTIVVGKTCSGKTSIVNKLCNDFAFEQCITATTRQPRPGEVEGVDYFFYSVNGFYSLINNMKLMEHVERNGNFYGTPLSEVINDTNNSNSKIIILDPEGAKSAELALSEKGIKIIKILIDASDDICIQRLLNRKADSGEIQKRMQELRNSRAWRDANKGLNYDLIISSDKFSIDEMADMINDVINTRLDSQSLSNTFSPIIEDNVIKKPEFEPFEEKFKAAARQYRIIACEE